jgi:hypothetical protein
MTLSPKLRKTLYSVTAGVNTIALAVVPLLVSFGIIDSDVAGKIVQAVGAILAIVSGVVAVNHVPAPAPAPSSDS